MVPIENGEDIQLLQYEIGEEYQRHPDFFNSVNKEDGDQRDITVLMYLTDVAEGGETIFPQGTWATEELAARFAAPAEKGYVNGDGVKLSSCASSQNEGIYVKPSAGDAVLFYGLTPDNREDGNSVHASCPVISGTKWSATIWMHVNPFRLATYADQQRIYADAQRRAVKRIVEEMGASAASAGGCRDLSPTCRDWALAGDCATAEEDMRSLVCCASCEVARGFGPSVTDTRLRDALAGS